MIHFAIFAKYWEPGKVKTRLAKTIGPELACQVYYRFLQHLLHQYGDFGDRRSVIFSPPDSQTLFRREVSDAWGLSPQSGGDLGQRMKQFFTDFAADGYKNILIGGDTPNLPLAYVRQAGQLLEECDVVFGPSGDGGYYLIAMKQPVTEIFDNVAWSTESVLTTTVEILDGIGASYNFLPEMRDVDQFEDLQRLVQQLEYEPMNESDAELLGSLRGLELSFE